MTEGESTDSDPEMDAVTIPERTLRDALNGELAAAMRTICLGLALAYALLSIWYVTELAGSAHDGAALLVDLGPLVLRVASGAMKPISTGLFSFGLLAAAFWFERNSLPTKLAHPVAAGIGVAVIANCLLLIVSADEPRQTTNLMVAQIGFGCLLYSTRWFALLSTASIGGWALVAGTRREEGDWYHFGIALLEATLFGLLVLGVRIRAAKKLQRMFLRDQVLKQRLRAASDAARIAVRAKSEFLANMSHEIRTPMTAMLGMTELLQMTELDPAQRDFADTVARAGDTLLSLVNDILDFSKIEAGQLSIEEVRFDLPELLAEVHELLAVKVQTKQLTLKVNIEDGIPRYYRGDPTRIKQVLVNLVGNAIKFTHSGTITLQANAKPTDDGRYAVTLAVTDTGIGIAPEHQARVFEAFVQADTSTTRRYGGTGLGLAISSQLVRLMHGEISLASTLGEGSTFTMTLPLPSESPGERVNSLAPPPPERTFHGRVLLVEDNLETKEVTRQMLERLGCTVEHAADGQEALDLLARETFDLVFMDCHMPRLNGYDATRELRRREQNGAHTKIIAFTASVLPEERQRCTEVGMDGYVAKPFTRKDLQTALERWL